MDLSSLLRDLDKGNDAEGEIDLYKKMPRSSQGQKFLPTNVVRYTIPERKPGYPWTELYGAMVAAFSFFCSGVVQSYTSGAIYSLQTDVTSNISLTQTEISWIASGPPFAALVGTLMSGPIMEQYGRKSAITFLSLPFIIGWLVIGTAVSFKMIFLGRLFTGISLGMSKASAPVYVSETARAQHRGKLGYLPAIMSAAGILLGCHLSSTLPWKELALIMIVFPSLLFIFSLPLPETPHWLIRQNQEDLALRSLKRLRFRKGDLSDDVRIYNEIQEIRGSIEEASTHENTGYLNILQQSDIRLPATLIFLLMIFQQFSGVSAVIYYMKMILNHGTATSPSQEALASGAVPHPPLDHHNDMRPAIFGAVHFLAFFITLPLVDRLGRKFLLKISGVLMALSHLILTFYMHVYCSPPKEVITIPVPGGPIPIPEDLHFHPIPSSIFSAAAVHSWLPLVSICAYIASFSLASPVPYILMGEMFGTSVRSYLCSASMLICSLASFLVVKLFPILMYGVSPTFTFFLFALFSLQTTTIGCIIPETKGKSLAEVEAIFKGPQSYLGKVKAEVQLPSSNSEVHVLMMSPPKFFEKTIKYERF